MTDIVGTVLITGASRGLGRHMAGYLVDRGFKLLAGVRSPKDGDRLQDECGSALQPLILDVTEPASVAAAVSTVRESTDAKGLVGIVNNAGLFALAPVEQQSLDEIEQLFRVNVFGVVAVTQAMLPLLRSSSGRVVNISSMNGWSSMPFAGAYCASKFALEALSDALRVEVRPFGVHVAVVQPGAMATDIRVLGAEAWAKAREGLSEAEKALYADAYQSIQAAVADVESVAGDIELISDAVFHALTDSEPKTRYAAGPMSDQREEMLALSDLERDEVQIEMLGLHSV
jgi:NAD(P)-dependent dehydrogenase (short-subunit alcohol dehydrogenase family)